MRDPSAFFYFPLGFLWRLDFNGLAQVMCIFDYARLGVY